VIDLPALLMLVAANSAPVLVARLLGNRYSAAIDAQQVFGDKRPLFGSHKTWRGLISGVLAAALVAGLLDKGVLLGAAFGALAMAGDLFSSFWKRRLGCESGEGVPLLDQLPEALLPMMLLGGVLDLTGAEMIATALAFTLLDAVGTVAARRARL
jgi:CDP-2,3-bis-(O-geranylgeranyl)-sn-glycerol synthase